MAKKNIPENENTPEETPEEKKKGCGCGKKTQAKNARAEYSDKNENGENCK